jgi:hypothetical protein
MVAPRRASPPETRMRNNAFEHASYQAMAISGGRRRR